MQESGAKIVASAQQRAMPEEKGNLDEKFAKQSTSRIAVQNKEVQELTKGVHTQQQLDDLLAAHKLENINRVCGGREEGMEKGR